MSQTNYKNYLWLIELLEENDRDGLTLKAITDAYETYRYHEESKVRKGLVVSIKGVDSLKRTTFITWRSKIYEHFKLIINTKDGQNRYYLVNPELLDEIKTLRETIKQLADEETREYEVKPLTFSKRGPKPKITSPSMDWIMTGDSDDLDYATDDDNTNLSIVRFCMEIGECLVVKKSIDRYVLEPHQLKHINGRYYVAGIQYKYGETDPYRETVIYDVDRLRMVDDEDIVTPNYQVDSHFDIESVLPKDWTAHFNPDKIVSLYLKTTRDLLKEKPFTQAQEEVKQSILWSYYRVFIKPDRDFLLQYLSYGDELTVWNPHPQIPVNEEFDITPEQRKYLKQLRK
jgi:hypothetical protein